MEESRALKLMIDAKAIFFQNTGLSGSPEMSVAGGGGSLYHR